MPMRRERIPERNLAVRLSDELIERLRMEAVRSGYTMREIVTDALNAVLPARIEMVATPKSRRVASGN